MASARPFRSSFASYFPLFVSIAAFGPFACASDDATTFGKPNAGAGATGAGSQPGKGGSSAAEGCGDLVACCLQLEGDDRATCQDLATAFAGQEKGDQNCAVALGGYRKSGACEGAPVGSGGSDDPGEGGAGGSEPMPAKGGSGGGGGDAGDAGTGGSTSKGGTGGGGGSTSKGGSGGGGGSTSKGGSGGGGGSTSKGGTGGGGGSTSKGGTGGTGGTGGSGGSTPATSEAAACQQWATSFCDRFATCGISTLRSVYEDEADCVTREAKAACPMRFFGSSTWTPAAVGACAADFGALQCGDLIVGTMPASCSPPAGLGQEKATCLADGDCASRSCSNGLLYFFSQIFFMKGSCETPIEDGDPCVPGEAPSCRSGRCDKTTKTCRAEGEQPAKCGSENTCSVGYRCTSGGACLPEKGAGEACLKDECSGRLGLTCGTQATCVPAVGPGPGATCDLFTTCERGAYCQASLLGGSCVDQLEAGQACSNTSLGGLPNVQSPCRYPLICTGPDGGETCQAPKI